MHKCQVINAQYYFAAMFDIIFKVIPKSYYQTLVVRNTTHRDNNTTIIRDEKLEFRVICVYYHRQNVHALIIMDTFQTITFR